MRDTASRIELFNEKFSCRKLQNYGPNDYWAKQGLHQETPALLFGPFACVQQRSMAQRIKSLAPGLSWLVSDGKDVLVVMLNETEQGHEIALLHISSTMCGPPSIGTNLDGKWRLRTRKFD